LHDVALARLSQLGFELSAISQSPTNSHNRGIVDTRIRSLIEDVDALIREVRNVVFDLANAEPGPDVETALRDLLADAAVEMGSEGDLSVDGPLESMPSPIARHVQAVAREAVRNAVVHSHASHLAVALSVEKDAVELSVTDDGVGPPEVPGYGLGLVSMAARARELRGTLTFGAGARGGTVLRWRVPC
jgi:signal transduction histidine kinase